MNVMKSWKSSHSYRRDHTRYCPQRHSAALPTHLCIWVLLWVGTSDWVHSSLVRVRWRRVRRHCSTGGWTGHLVRGAWRITWNKGKSALKRGKRSAARCFPKSGTTIFVLSNSVSFMWVLPKLVPISKPKFYHLPNTGNSLEIVFDCVN